MKINKFTDLEVWKSAHNLTLGIYQITNSFPKSEVYGLTSQIRRAAVSVESCVAEGFSRYHYKDRLRFYYDARGSISEVQSQLITAKDLRKGFKVTATGEQSSENTLTTEEIKIDKMPNIVVFSPTNLEDVGKSFLISGIARVFENKLSIMLTNSRTNTVLIKKTIDAKSPDTGKFVDFEYLTKIGNASLNDQDPLVLEVYSNSPKDGEKINYVSLNLIFRK